MKSFFMSVVVSTMNRLEDIERCLNSLSRQEFSNFEVVVVDSSSEVIAEEVRYIAQKHNAKYTQEQKKGLSIARNKGVRESSGEIVVFTDDDAVPETSWLKEISAAFENDAVGFVCGKILTVNNDIEVGVSASQGTYENVYWGVNLAFRRYVLEKIGGFDETFQLAGEDLDVVLKALNAGFKGSYTPKAKVWHVKPACNSLKKVVKSEERNCRGDLFLISKDAKLLISNFKTAPKSLLMNVFSTLCLLSLLPLLIAIVLFFSLSSVLWVIPLALIFTYLAVRLLLSKARSSALIIATILTPFLSPVYWFYLIQMLSKNRRFSTNH